MREISLVKEFRHSPHRKNVPQLSIDRVLNIMPEILEESSMKTIRSKGFKGLEGPNGRFDFLFREIGA